MGPLAAIRRLPPSRRFLVMACVNFALNLGLMSLLYDALGLHEYAAIAITLTLVTLFSFVMFRYVVFESVQRNIAVQFAEFVASVAGFRAVEAAGFYLLTQVWPVHPVVKLTAVLTATFVGKFLLYRLRVFAPRPGASRV